MIRASLRREAGFTLVEMATLIIIIGLLMVPLMDLYRTKLIQDRRTKTWENIEAVREALTWYQFYLGEYPIPAPLALGPGGTTSNTSYGVSYPQSDISSIVPGSCDTVAGFCVLDSGRPSLVAGVDENILIGAFPINTYNQAVSQYLAANPNSRDQIPKVTMDQVHDAWNNKIVYAVTQRLTDVSIFNPSAGAINVIDETGQNVIAPPDSAHYVLVSYGDDGIGAYSREGSRGNTNCPTGIEGLNCNKPAAGVSNTFRSALRSVGPGAGYYDDMVRFVSWTSSALWSTSSKNADSAYNTTPGNVGVGIQNPQSKLDVSGNLRAPGALAAQLCDVTGNNCITPDDIGGSGHNCNAPGMAVNAIGRNSAVNRTNVDVECAPIFSAPPDQACPAGEYLNGYSNRTGPICCTNTLPPVCN